MRRFLKPWFRSSAVSMLAAVLFPVAAHAAGDPAAGERVFASKCAQCHRVGPSARGGFGPQLNGLIGRQAGSVSEYRYSDAMKSAGFAWNEDRLRAFVKSPGKVVPGNKMLFWGMRDDKDIDDLLAYLRTFP